MGRWYGNVRLYMSKRIRYEDVKKYCIPNLRAIDDDGNVHPVVTTIQAQYEWSVEYRRAEIYRKWCGYVDNFLSIIVINAPDDVKLYIRNALYEYGRKDAETLLYSPE